jgi:hypothetical protein
LSADPSARDRRWRRVVVVGSPPAPLLSRLCLLLVVGVEKGEEKAVYEGCDPCESAPPPFYLAVIVGVTATALARAWSDYRRPLSERGTGRGRKSPAERARGGGSSMLVLGQGLSFSGTPGLALEKK